MGDFKEEGELSESDASGHYEDRVMKANDYSNKQFALVTKKLWESHFREGQKLLSNPKEYHSFDKEWINFVQKRTLMILSFGGDTFTYDYESEFTTHWSRRLDEIMREKWKRKLRLMEKFWKRRTVAAGDILALVSTNSTDKEDNSSCSCRSWSSSDSDFERSLQSKDTNKRKRSKKFRHKSSSNCDGSSSCPSSVERKVSGCRMHSLRSDESPASDMPPTSTTASPSSPRGSQNRAKRCSGSVSSASRNSSVSEYPPETSSGHKLYKSHHPPRHASRSTNSSKSGTRSRVTPVSPGRSRSASRLRSPFPSRSLSASSGRESESRSESRLDSDFRSKKTEHSLHTKTEEEEVGSPRFCEVSSNRSRSKSDSKPRKSSSRSISGRTKSRSVSSQRSGSRSVSGRGSRLRSVSRRNSRSKSVLRSTSKSVSRKKSKSKSVARERSRSRSLSKQKSRSKSDHTKKLKLKRDARRRSRSKSVSRRSKSKRKSRKRSRSKSLSKRSSKSGSSRRKRLSSRSPRRKSRSQSYSRKKRSRTECKSEFVSRRKYGCRSGAKKDSSERKSSSRSVSTPRNLSSKKRKGDRLDRVSTSVEGVTSSLQENQRIREALGKVEESCNLFEATVKDLTFGAKKVDVEFGKLDGLTDRVNAPAKFDAEEGRVMLDHVFVTSECERQAAAGSNKYKFQIPLEEIMPKESVDSLEHFSKRESFLKGIMTHPECGGVVEIARPEGGKEMMVSSSLLFDSGSQQCKACSEEPATDAGISAEKLSKMLIDIFLRLNPIKKKLGFLTPAIDSLLETMKENVMEGREPVSFLARDCRLTLQLVQEKLRLVNCSGGPLTDKVKLVSEIQALLNYASSSRREVSFPKRMYGMDLDQLSKSTRCLIPSEIKTFIRCTLIYDGFTNIDSSHVDELYEAMLNVRGFEETDFH